MTMPDKIYAWPNTDDGCGIYASAIGNMSDTQYFNREALIKMGWIPPNTPTTEARKRALEAVCELSDTSVLKDAERYELENTIRAALGQGEDSRYSPDAIKSGAIHAVCICARDLKAENELYKAAVIDLNNELYHMRPFEDARTPAQIKHRDTIIKAEAIKLAQGE